MDIENTEESIRGAEDELQEAPDQQMPEATQQEVVEGANPLEETSPMELFFLVSSLMRMDAWRVYTGGVLRI